MTKFIEKAQNCFRNFFLKRIIEKLKKKVETEFYDEVLELLLKAIRLFLYINKDFRKNIDNFDAQYVFQSQDGLIAASAIFKDEKMTVYEDKIMNANVTVTFKDGKAIWDFLMSSKPDIFAFVLQNKLSYSGNLNYIMKFAYIANHLKLKFSL